MAVGTQGPDGLRQEAVGRRPDRQRRRMLLVVVAVLLLTACSGSGPSEGGDGQPRVLNIGQTAPPNSLDPARINQAFEWYVNLAYDPLIYKAPDGSLQPRLAESFGYLGEGNTTFQMKLREGVRFSDGSPLTADVVSRNIDYFRQAGGQAVPYLTPIESVEVVDELTIRLGFSSPHPAAPFLFTQDFLAGNVISGQALDTPEMLTAQTAGAGPYILDAARTVPGDRYVYTPNPQYWNPDDIHYDQVTIKVLPNSNTALSALRSGQVDVIQSDFTTAESATEAGLEVKYTPLVFVGIAFADRTGELLEPLGDLRVRQAINYALDREAITAAVFGEFGIPTEQVVPPGWDGYNQDQFYTYDLDRARALLAEAGYPEGFDLPVLATPFASQELVVQAMADQLREIGVNVQITSEADTAKFFEELTSGRFPAYGIGYGAQPIHLMGPGLFLPDAAVFNPLGSTDAVLLDLYQQQAATPPDARAPIERQLVRRLVEQAWFAPVAIFPVFFYSDGTVEGIEPTPGQPIANPVAWHPAEP